MLTIIVEAPVVQTLDSAIHRINHYPADSVIDFLNTYPLDGDISNVWTTGARSKTAGAIYIGHT